MKVTLLIAVCLCSLNVLMVQGAAWFSEAEIERVYGRRVWYCEYKGLRLLPGTRIKDYDDCSECRCRRSGLSCYTTLPIMVSTPDEDSLCMPINVRCKQIWVLRKKPFIKCPDDQIPAVSMVGK